MKELTLNKCLNNLDMILFDNVEDSYIIVEILNDVRKYVINSNLKNKESTDQQKTFMITLQFINYMIQESFSSITNQFINHTLGLRSLVLKLELGCILCVDGEIDFDQECNTFINEHIIDDEDGND